jgi:hypothetical protein
MQPWGARALYEDFYCACGECENRIKEAQLDLFADRLIHVSPNRCEAIETIPVAITKPKYAGCISARLRSITTLRRNGEACGFEEA